jgi:hypothetical protein
VFTIQHVEGAAKDLVGAEFGFDYTSARDWSTDEVVFYCAALAGSHSSDIAGAATTLDQSTPRNQSSLKLCRMKQKKPSSQMIGLCWRLNIISSRLLLASSSLAHIMIMVALLS